MKVSFVFNNHLLIRKKLMQDMKTAITTIQQKERQLLQKILKQTLQELEKNTLTVQDAYDIIMYRFNIQPTYYINNPDTNKAFEAIEKMLTKQLKED